MRMPKAVRIGGRLALLAGFAVSSLVNGNTLSYFNGYSSPNLAAWGATDTLGSQNVRFVPQVSLVSPSSNLDVFSSTSAFNWGSSSAYTGVSAGFSPTYSSSDSAYGWQGFGSVANNGLAVYGSPTTSTSTNSSNYSSVNYTNVNGASTWNAWFNSGSTGSGSGGSALGWSDVQFSITPAVSNNFTPPTVQNPIVNNPVYTTDPFASPEPATFGFMAAGLAGLLIVRRKLR